MRDGDVTGYSRLRPNAGYCDAPGCHNKATWKVTFYARGYLYLCRPHKDEVKRRKGASGADATVVQE